jgi:arylsulfatase A-like enzyme
MGGGVTAGLGRMKGQNDCGGTVPGPAPNILFILVDELRYPTVFPAGVHSPGEFLEKFMPNVHRLWREGVKFGNHHNAANACTPSRGVILTGLYSQQHWLLSTILDGPTTTPPAHQPVLNPAFPTWGKLLRTAGYQTPYIGKWHVSIPSQSPGTLDPYGFDFMSYYDPTGDNLQGTYGDETQGFHNDAYCASQAVDWLTQTTLPAQPWCLTVSLVNPHDREFYPAGTEFQTVSNLFADSAVNPKGWAQLQPGYGVSNGPIVPWSENALKDPPPYGYPTLPPNWENCSSLEEKPSTQTFVNEFAQGTWGGVTDDPNQDIATVAQYPNPNSVTNLNLGVAKMPFSYWQRGLDSYTQVMQIVDCQIGRVLEALHSLPRSVVENTVVVFASDHGEYSGAHGFVQGKMGSVYEEAFHIPLIVVDPSGRFVDDTHKIRTGLTSSVDFLNLMVSLGYKGSNQWMNSGNLAQIYGSRHDMIPMLKSAHAPGRPYVLLSTDEIVPDYFNFNNAPTHVVGVRTNESKLGMYTKWVPPTSNIIPTSTELEFYDYSTTRGRLELANTVSTDPRVPGILADLLNNLIPNELQETLPGTLALQQQASKTAHLVFRAFIQAQPSGVWQNGGLQSLLGYGLMF